MMILGIKADFKSRRHSINWLLDRFDVLVEMDAVIITLTEPIEAIKRNM